MGLEASEFIRRFLLHTLPKGLVRIRRYGLLANAQREHKLARCRELLGSDERTMAPATSGAGLLMMGLDPTAGVRILSSLARGLGTVAAFIQILLPRLMKEHVTVKWSWSSRTTHAERLRSWRAGGAPALELL